MLFSLMIHTAVLASTGFDVIFFSREGMLQILSPEIQRRSMVRASSRWAKPMALLFLWLLSE